MRLIRYTGGSWVSFTWHCQSNEYGKGTSSSKNVYTGFRLLLIEVKNNGVYSCRSLR